jgi:putative radical SAM enzyme (TIGR03279 family)
MAPAASAARGGLVTAVQPQSLAHEVGIEPGDRLLAINGRPVRDEIDVRFYGADEELILVLERGGRRHTIEIERDYEEPLGLVFAEPLFDGIRECANHCPFCFVAQMPPRSLVPMRPSLYLRDDDYRLSFLQGSFVTLTNLDEADWQRIGEQRLTPLYVSVHAADPEVRRTLLGNAAAPPILPQLARLGGLGITVHAQVVIVPGMNDGPVLADTIERLLALWPSVQTLALVPVGLTRFCRRPMATVTPTAARAILDLADAHRPAIRAATDTTWLYPSDELYLLAGRPMPPAAFYRNDAQRENGVGLVRELLDDWAETRRALRDVAASGLKATLVCGKLVAPVLEDLVAQASDLTGARLVLLPVENRWFGESVTVSGLLTGADVLGALQGRDLGDLVCIPRAMLDETGRRTLDDVTLEELSATLQAPVVPVAAMSDLMAALGELVDSRQGGAKET